MNRMLFQLVWHCCGVPLPVEGKHKSLSAPHLIWPNSTVYQCLRAVLDMASKSKQKDMASSLQMPGLGLTLRIKDPKQIPQSHLKYSRGYHCLIFPKLQHQTSLLDGSYDRHKVGKTCLGLRCSLHLIATTEILPWYCFHPSINH